MAPQQNANSQANSLTEEANNIDLSALIISKLIHQLPVEKTLFIKKLETQSSWLEFQSLLKLKTQEEEPEIVGVVYGSHQIQSELDNIRVIMVDPLYEGTVEDAIQECCEADQLIILAITSDPSSHNASANSHHKSPEIQSLVPTETAREDRRAIRNKSFRTHVRHWISTYNKVGNRDWFLWQWCLHGIEMTVLPSVPEEYREDLADTKLLSVILCVLLDDVADQPGNENWLNDLLVAIRQHKAAANGALPAPVLQNSEDPDLHTAHIQVTAHLWSIYESRVRSYPFYSDLERVWRFDIEQFITAMRYGQLMNDIPELANATEQDVYTPHNMLMVSFGSLDLMCSHNVPLEEYGLIREALWHAQAMGRVGNVLSTWKRELTERDMSNGLVARALSAGIFTKEQFLTSPVELLEARLNEEGYQKDLMEKWHRHRSICQQNINRVYSMDMLPTLHAHERFLEMHLGSEGLI